MFPMSEKVEPNNYTIQATMTAAPDYVPSSSLQMPVPPGIRLLSRTHQVGTEEPAHKPICLPFVRLIPRLRSRKTAPARLTSEFHLLRSSLGSAGGSAFTVNELINGLVSAHRKAIQLAESRLCNTAMR